MRRRQPNRNRQIKKDLHEINHHIKCPKIRVVEGLDPDVYDTSYALEKANEMDLDLVMISKDANPPVCKILDYRKFLYNASKREKDIKRKIKKVVTKEIRFGPNTGENDVAFKLKHAINFLKEGNRLKAFVFFKGRNIVHKDRGHVLLLQFAQDLAEYGKVTQLPKMEGKKMILLMEAIK